MADTYVQAIRLKVPRLFNSRFSTSGSRAGIASKQRGDAAGWMASPTGEVPMNIRFVTAIALVALSLPLEAAAQRQAPVRRSAMSQMDVAGVKLGMTLPEAKAALIKNGYQIDTSRFAWDQPSWEENVRYAVRQRTGQKATSTEPALREVKTLFGKGPRQQELEITFAAVPGGAKVEQVRYKIPFDQITRADFERNALAKYGTPNGRPSNFWGPHHRWCNVGERNCSAMGVGEPNLEVFTAGRLHHVVELQGHSVVGKAKLEALFAGEVERRAPRTRETAF